MIENFYRLCVGDEKHPDPVIYTDKSKADSAAQERAISSGLSVWVVKYNDDKSKPSRMATVSTKQRFDP